MLDARTDTIDYGELLIPPPGFLLERAVATTYSLDLNALLAIPVAMYYSKTIETDFTKNPDPFDVIHAISEAKKSVTVFCQRGKIQVPNKHNKLISFTQDCIVEVTPEKDYSSFHPKCWWLLFKNKKTGEKIFRCSVMSRNMTFDRSWDVAFSFDGVVGYEIQEKNKPMLEMLKYLERASGNKIDNQFKKDLQHTEFKVEYPFNNWSFIPIGISKNHTHPFLSKNFKSDVLLMMSPFIDDKSLNDIASILSKKSWLFSKKIELQKLKLETFGNVEKVYCIPDIIVEGELDEIKADEIPDSEPQSLDLHAKLFIKRKGNKNTWLLGSANLTAPAFGRNIECFIELKSNVNTTSPESIRKDLVCNVKEKKIFKEYEYCETQIDKNEEIFERQLRKIEFQLIKFILKGKVLLNSKTGLYNYEINIDASHFSAPSHYKIYVLPFYEDKSTNFGERLFPGQNNIIKFKNSIKESLLSNFFIINIIYKQICKKSFIVKAEIEIPKTRDGKILTEILHNSEKFLQYFRFLLSDTGTIDNILTDDGIQQNSNLSESWNILSKYRIPLYEELLKTSSQNPERLKIIDDLFTKILSNEETIDIISPEIIEVWKIFKQIIK